MIRNKTLSDSGLIGMNDTIDEMSLPEIRAANSFNCPKSSNVIVTARRGASYSTPQLPILGFRLERGISISRRSSASSDVLMDYVRVPRTSQSQLNTLQSAIDAISMLSYNTAPKVANKLMDLKRRLDKIANSTA